MNAGTRRRVALLVTGGIVSGLAVALLSGGAWALAQDRSARDAGGYVSLATTSRLDTGTYALVSELHGDGPSWLYGSAVMGDARVRATSQNGQSLFVGIARTADVSRYLGGAGYATVEHIATNAVTTHAGGAPATAPAQLSIWAASTQGTGERTLTWQPRDGDWSIVVMNADASAGVAVQGSVSAKAPILPWLALSGLLGAVLFGVVGGWLLVRGIRTGKGVGAEGRGLPTTRPPRVPAGTAREMHR